MSTTDRHPTDRKRTPVIPRLAMTLLALTAIIVSLLSFPSVLPAVVAAWLAWHSWKLANSPAIDFSGWTLLAILAAKQPERSWPFLILASLVLVSSALTLLRRRIEWPVLTVWLSVVWIAWIGFCTERWAATTCSTEISQAGPIVCIGDSLTSYGYPQQLDKILTEEVLDFGLPGITSAEGLERLEEIKATQPSVVVIELGGHDFLRHKGRAQTKANLVQLIKGSQAAGAVVVLMEIPRGFIYDGYYGLERELAREHDLQLISDGVIRNLVLWSPVAPPGMWCSSSSHLSEDGLHPNELGNKFMAERIAHSVQSLLDQ